jgi:hypothetical protein
MVRHKRHVPSQRIPGRAHLHDAGVVEQADDRKMERDNLRSCAPHRMRNLPHIVLCAQHIIPIDNISHTSHSYAYE